MSFPLRSALVATTNQFVQRGARPYEFKSASATLYCKPNPGSHSLKDIERFDFLILHKKKQEVSIFWNFSSGISVPDSDWRNGQ